MTRRQKRYAELFTHGFTHQESLAMSWIDKRRYKNERGKTVAEGYEWFEKLKRERFAKYQKLCVVGVRKRGVKGLVRISRKAFLARVEQSYRTQGWMTVDWRGRRVINPYELVQKYRDEWADDHPGYRSPSDITHDDFQKFVRALNKSLTGS